MKESVLERLARVHPDLEIWWDSSPLVFTSWVKKMVDGGKDCLQVLTQLKAIKAAVGGVMDTVVEEQFDTCMKSIKDEDKKLLIKIKDYVKSN